MLGHGGLRLARHGSRPGASADGVYGPRPYAPTPYAPSPYAPAQPARRPIRRLQAQCRPIRRFLMSAPTDRSLPSPAAVSAATGQTIVLQVVVEGAKGNVDKGLPRLKTRSGEPYEPQIVEDDVRLLLKSRKYVRRSRRRCSRSAEA